jgi:hypothetical protein
MRLTTLMLGVLLAIAGCRSTNVINRGAQTLGAGDAGNVRVSLQPAGDWVGKCPQLADQGDKKFYFLGFQNLTDPPSSTEWRPTMLQKNSDCPYAWPFSFEMSDESDRYYDAFCSTCKIEQTNFRDKREQIKECGVLVTASVTMFSIFGSFCSFVCSGKDWPSFAIAVAACASPAIIASETALLRVRHYENAHNDGTAILKVLENINKNKNMNFRRDVFTLAKSLCEYLNPDSCEANPTLKTQ